MSEMAPERAPQPRKKGGLKGALTHKIGPLPAWVWIVIVAGIILAWVVFKNHQASKQQQQASVKPGAGQVPQFVNQVYTNPQPPAAPDQDQDEDKTPGGGGDKDRMPPVIVPNPKRPPSRPPQDDDDRMRPPPPKKGPGGPPPWRRPRGPLPPKRAPGIPVG